MILISGRVDQKGEGETKLVAQAVRAFTPEEGGEEERLAGAGRRRPPRARPRSASSGGCWPTTAATRRSCCDVRTDEGRRRRLRLGEEFRVDPRDSGLVAELKTLFGERCLA